MNSRKSAGGLVYSTEGGRMCPGCRRPVLECACAAQAPLPRGDGVVRVSRETQGRKGKGVTVVRGVDLPAPELAEMGKRLKTACGSGGTVKDGVIEIQGDHCERVIAFFKAEGRVVKRAGG